MVEVIAKQDTRLLGKYVGKGMAIDVNERHAEALIKSGEFKRGKKKAAPIVGANKKANINDGKNNQGGSNET